MKIDTTNWKEFEVQELFDVVYGVNLELVNCVETDKNDSDAVAFVSRTEFDDLKAKIEGLIEKKGAEV